MFFPSRIKQFLSSSFFFEETNKFISYNGYYI